MELSIQTHDFCFLRVILMACGSSGQGLNPSCNCNHSCCNARSFNPLCWGTELYLVATKTAAVRVLTDYTTAETPCMIFFKSFFTKRNLCTEWAKSSAGSRKHQSLSVGPVSRRRVFMGRSESAEWAGGILCQETGGKLED